MEYHMLYVKIRKNFEVRRQKFYYFTMCQNKTHGKLDFAVCQKKYTANYFFAVCQKKAHGKG